MPKPEFDWKWTPSALLSGAQLLALLIGLLTYFTSMSGDLRADRIALAALQSKVAEIQIEAQTQVGKLQNKDDSTVELVRTIQGGFGTRLTKLEVDVTYIKEGIARIEQRQQSGSVR